MPISELGEWNRTIQKRIVETHDASLARHTVVYVKLAEWSSPTEVEISVFVEGVGLRTVATWSKGVWAMRRVRSTMTYESF
jgi:hypothetical protein